MIGQFLWLDTGTVGAISTLYISSLTHFITGFPRLGQYLAMMVKCLAWRHWILLQSEKSKGLRTKIKFVCRDFQIGQSGLESVRWSVIWICHNVVNWLTPPLFNCPGVEQCGRSGAERPWECHHSRHTTHLSTYYHSLLTYYSMALNKGRRRKGGKVSNLFVCSILVLMDGAKCVLIFCSWRFLQRWWDRASCNDLGDHQMLETNHWMTDTSSRRSHAMPWYWPPVTTRLRMMSPWLRGDTSVLTEDNCYNLTQLHAKYTFIFIAFKCRT